MTTHTHSTQLHFARRQAGFTLPELMVTLLILAIVIGIAVPGLQSLMRKQSLNSETNLMVSTLAYARSEAVARVVPVVLCGSTDAATCNGTSSLSQGWLIFLDRDGNNSFNSGDELLRRGGGNSDLSVTLSASATYVRYSEQGESNALRNIAVCTADAGTNPDKARTVTIAVGGGSRIAAGASCP